MVIPTTRLDIEIQAVEVTHRYSFIPIRTLSTCTVNVRVQGENDRSVTWIVRRGKSESTIRACSHAWKESTPPVSPITETSSQFLRRELDDPSIVASKMSEQWDLQICCMGAGYVGGPTMAVIAKNCPKVRCCREEKRPMLTVHGLVRSVCGMAGQAVAELAHS